ncbi:hypothetical protein IC757_04165 [Wenzhouxiangella sp. AB-CW3]|uniref:mevalonate kinase family protein n=1 Tax=Wenzhouxiangella sp. AB-CW3 TaxID=2771012 RepID=UPI00168B2D62|nr:hypothetical protein [Wenzhouxiangella sp. AB-CW3]QOC23348.1 hypothetical protein IC757_04165 [Wenzhouxiangella sp. AB-CW3]
MPLKAGAPGKAVLLGEYAVLDGAPALSLAVDRRARVDLEASSGVGRIEAPQLDIEPIAFEIGAHGALSWSGAENSLAAFRRTAAILEHLVAHAWRRYGGVEPFKLRIDTGGLFHGGIKLGLGSSAASVVALDAAITAHASRRRGRESPEQVLERLLPVYRSSQGGHGSGIDLATSLYGGAIAYRLAGPRPVVQPVALPEGLHLMFIWTGQAASTPDLVAAWFRFLRRHPDDARELVNAMRRVCHEGLEAQQAGDAGELVRQIGEYGRVLGTMGDCAGIPVVTAAHRRAMDLALEHGAVCKPCGAGGGDLAVAAATSPQALASLADALRGTGLDAFSLAAGKDGSRVTEA